MPGRGVPKNCALMENGEKCLKNENLPETPPGGYLFRLHDVEKQRERRKTKAKKKGREKKEEKLGNMKNPHVFVGVFLGQFSL